MIDDKLGELIEAVRDEKQIKRDIDALKAKVRFMENKVNWLDKADDSYTDAICKLHLKINETKDRLFWWNIGLGILHSIFIILFIVKNFVM